MSKRTKNWLDTRLKMPLATFFDNLRAARTESFWNGMWVGLLINALFCATGLLFVTATESADYRKRCAAVSVEWTKALNDVREDTATLKQRLANEQRERVRDQNHMFEMLHSLDQRKADLPKVWNGEKVNE